MAKKKTKKGCKLGAKNVGLIVLSVAMLALVANYALAGTSIRQEIVTLVAERLLGQINAEEQSLGSSEWTNLTALQIAEDLQVSGTTTLNILTHGSGDTDTLTFTAAATTTPGGLFSIQNTGATKICNEVALDITTGPRGGAFIFSVTTSTSASGYSGVYGSLIASSTNATNTAAIWSNEKGTAKMNSWLWTAGTYLIGTFDGSSGAASSTDYTNAVGNFYVNCYSR